MTNRYFIRAVKYFVYLLLLFFIIYAILVIVGQTHLSSFTNILHSNKLWFLIAIFVILPAMQPSYGYITREVRGRMVTDENRQKVLQTMELNRYILVKEVHGTMTFRAGSLPSRLRLLFEDKIIITLSDDKIIVTGPRKEVVKTEFRLKTFL